MLNDRITESGEIQISLQPLLNSNLIKCKRRQTTRSKQNITNEAGVLSDEEQKTVDLNGHMKLQAGITNYYWRELAHIFFFPG